MQGDVGKFYEENMGLVHTVARKGYGRLQAIGSSIGYDDLVQDMSMVFIHSFELFDPEKGKFSTYFMQAAFHQLNKMADKIADERITNGVRSVEEMGHRDDGDDYDVLDHIDLGVEGPEQIMIGCQTTERLLSKLEKLSPLAKLIADWMVNTPEEVEREFQARTAHAQLSRNLGVERRCQEAMTIGFVCDMLKLTGKFSTASIISGKRELEFKMREALK